MSAEHIVRRLIEEPEDDPLGIGPLERYTGPVEFNTNIKDVVEHAQFLKQQAEQAGALALLTQKYKMLDIDRAFLTIAVEQYNEELVAPRKIAQILNREMHSIWS
jgi:dTDP-4-amino-4,6-dideoxygalactose transaminase